MVKKKRRVIKGVSVSPGIASGTAAIMLPGEQRVEEVTIPAAQVDNEIECLETAVAQTISEMKGIRRAAGKRVGGPVAKIFDAQLLIAADQQFLEQVKEQISSRRRNAGFVYHSLVKSTLQPLKSASDAYLQEMAHDIEAVSNRILSRLGGYRPAEEMKFTVDTVLVAPQVSPAEVLTLRQRRINALVVGEGGRNSHMALIARSLMVPAVVIPNVWTRVPEGCPVIVDATTGKIIVCPTDKDFEESAEKRRKLGPAIVTRIKQLADLPPKTADGEVVHIAANLELPGPVDEIIGARGIPVGLYRTEFLYLEHRTFPDEQVQFEQYDSIAEKYAGSHVVLRTFDLGSDKVRRTDNHGREDNPALGWRGIRSMLEMPDTFKTQVRAMLRASTRRNIRLLLPMISDIAELERARRLISQASFELRREGVSFDPDLKIGIMIEVPSAALTADRLASRAGFVSIGTNDLTQYTMSADRNNARVAGLYNHFHPSVLQLIRMTVEACRRHNTPVNVCGEMAGDPLAVPLFIGMGVRDLSLNPARIVDTCRLIRKLDSSNVKHLAQSVLGSGSTVSVKRKLQNFNAALDKL